MSREYGITVAIRILVVLTALPLHECAHGFIAYKLGDPTAKNMGRLTLNPFKHFDLFGTMMLLLTGFGFAKPVPINPAYFKNRKSGMALSALAGPMSNLLFAFVLLLVGKGALYFIPMNETAFMVVRMIVSVMITTNIGLAIFNMIPIPPLDGSKVLAFFLSDRTNYRLMAWEGRYQMFLIFGLFILLSTGVLSRPLNLLADLVYNGLDFLTGFMDLLARVIAT
ncbi:site-2 protease family protein [Massiliimalia massiliensis]|uniref:site-2 protease family protein n=1 Tax=Massiliimalia massiliensis TaxID=1852384 RepID=UPI000985D4C9|nr:site-2 protease family protein [Massiliimalia massiliensis]